MQKVKIALSGHTILFFPFYLLAKDPLSYGLNGFEIILENKNGDLQALDAIGKDCQFGVCDPALLYKYTLDETITRTAIKPIIIKTALWGVTNHFKFKEFGRNEMFLAKMESSNTINTQFKNIHTYHDGTTAYKSMEYLKKPISKFKNFTTKDTETVAHSIIGKEFLPFYQKNNNQDLVITSDILKIIILEKDKHKFKCLVPKTYSQGSA